jgi:hypothetical protein
VCTSRQARAGPSKLHARADPIDGALNAVCDIFQATDEELSLVFPHGEDIAFIDEVVARRGRTDLDGVFSRIWKRRIPKAQAICI